MSKIQIYAGDFPTGVGHFTFRNFTLPNNDHHGICNTVCMSEVELINKATMDMVLMLAPDDEHRKKLPDEIKGEILFVARFKDNKRLIGSTDEVTFSKMKKAFAATRSQPPEKNNPQQMAKT